MIQVAAQLLITPTREHLVDSLGLRINTGTEPATHSGRSYRRAERASDLSHPMHH
jgi:hypothetical protein